MNKKIGIISLIVVIAIAGIYLALRDKDNNERTGDFTFTHDLGEAVVNRNPKRVIVFDLGIADALHELEVDIIGLPKATLPGYLKDIYGSSKYQNVGSLKDPDFEKIKSLDPDLIIISGRQSTLYNDFDEIAPTLYLPLDNSNYIESFKKNMEILGKIFEKEEQIETIVEEIEKDIKTVREAMAGTDNKALILMVMSDKLQTFGVGSRFGIIHNEFGIPAVDPSIDTSTHGNELTSEFISKYNPDYIFVIDRNVATGEKGESPTKEIVENSLVKRTNAYKNGNIIYLDSEVWYLSTGGIQSTKKMVQEVRDAILK